MDRRRLMTGVLTGLMMLALVACNLGVREEMGDGPDGGTKTPDDRPTPTVEGAKGDDLESLGGGFVWRREGGIAGFCDVVTVASTGRATVASCATDPPQALGEVALTANQSAQLAEMVSRLASFDDERKDPATADAMTIAIVFEGQGDAQPTDADIAAIDALATEVLRASADAPLK